MRVLGSPVERPTVIGNAVSSLIVQSTDDTRTTHAGAQVMHRAMTGSRMVTLEDVAVHWIYGNYPNTCVDTTVNTYLRDGTLPDTDLICQDDPGRESR